MESPRIQLSRACRAILGAGLQDIFQNSGSLNLWLTAGKKTLGSISPLPFRGRGDGGRGAMPIGVMLRWNDEKGFGFIRPSDIDGPDLFCHKSSLLDGEGSILDGDEVKFVMEYDERKGKDRAIEVERYIRSSHSPPPRYVPPPSNARREGDWDCPSCGFHNFANKEECMKCGLRKASVERVRKEKADAAEEDKKKASNGKDDKADKDKKERSRERRTRRSRDRRSRDRRRGDKERSQEKDRGDRRNKERSRDRRRRSRSERGRDRDRRRRDRSGS
ncbi:unnamed protein product [Symbiodinium sp. KB8]|nr:unnamed protein product [Symbiodinium sp. KB8]